MNTTQISTGDLTAAITIEILAADYKGKVIEELKKQAKKAQMPGFRPGKVPVGVVRKMVGKAVVIEEVTKAVSDELSDYIKREDIKILGDPMPRERKSEEEFDEYGEKDMEFIFDIGLAPEFDLSFDLPSAPPSYNIEIDDEFINKEIENYQDRFAEVTNPETASEGDIIYGKLYEVDDKGEEVEDGFNKMISLSPQRVENDAFFTPFVGKDLEFTTDFDPFSINEDAAKVGDILFMKEDELAELKDKKFKFQLKRINHVVAKELSEELFLQIAGSLQWPETDDIKEEAGFRAKLSETLKNDMLESSKWYFRNEAQKQMIEMHEMPFPEDFLKKWLQESNEQQSLQQKKQQNLPEVISDEERENIKTQVEGEFEEFLKSLKWTLIVGKIQDSNPETVVESEDLKDGIRSYMTERYSQMEGQKISDEQMEEYLNYTLQNEELVRMHYKRMSDEKLFDYLLTQVTGEEKTINATDFSELIKPEEK